MAGRPRKEINWPEFDKLCELQCTLNEIASWFECSPDTIERAVKREYKTNFAEYYSQKAEKGKISLRRKQWQVALSGDKTMLIWLGKQYLDQRERASHELSGPNGKPIETADRTQMTDEQINARIQALLEKEKK